MLWVAFPLGAALLLGASRPAVAAEEAVRFDRPLFTTEGTVLCPSQGDVAALRRAADGGDTAAFERIAGRACKMPGPDIRLSVVARPGLYDPDVEVRVAAAPGLDPGLPRGKVWTLKAMLRNQPGAAPAPR